MAVGVLNMLCCEFFPELLLASLSRLNFIGSAKQNSLGYFLLIPTHSSFIATMLWFDCSCSASEVLNQPKGKLEVVKIVTCPAYRTTNSLNAEMQAEEIPWPALHCVFEKLPVWTVLSCELVCKSWNNAVRSYVKSKWSFKNVCFVCVLPSNYAGSIRYLCVGYRFEYKKQANSSIGARKTHRYSYVWCRYSCRFWRIIFVQI